MFYDSLIFDLDGTLWNCSAASAHAFNLAYEKFDLPTRVTKEFVESISGKPSTECEDILLESVPVEIHDAMRRHLDECEIAAITNFAPHALYPEVELGLKELSQRYKLSLVSNCGELYLDIFHQKTAVGSLFTDSECFGRTKKLKHENIQLLIERQQLRSPCYIGDTAGDEEAANKAKVPFFHAAYGFGKPQGNPIGFSAFRELTDYFLALTEK